MKMSYYKKYLAVAVILLFIGVAFAPSVNASVVEDDLVEFDVEFCGLGKKHTVKLTREEADEVEQLFDEIRQQLENVETREEAEEIFKEAVVELDKYGFLDGLSIKMAQKLISGLYLNSKVFKSLNKTYKKHTSSEDKKENYFCFVIGITNRTVFQGTLSRYMFIIFTQLLYNSDNRLLNLLFLYSLLPFVAWDIIRPFQIGSQIKYSYPAASGYINTLGLCGLKSWTGNLVGEIDPWYSSYTHLWTGSAAVGFTGIRFTNYRTGKSYYIGHALKVIISYYDGENQE